MQYYMFNKPGGCITARRDDTHKTIMDYFPENMRNVLHPLGRLDLDTEGLLIVTDDGQLDMQIMQPHNHVPKKYYFWAIGSIDAEKMQRLEAGVMLTGQTEPTKPAEIRCISSGKMKDIVHLIPGKYREKMRKNPEIPVFEAYLSITEGRKHQVKRMIRSVGCCVVYLKRVSIGSLELDESLLPGEYRELSADELELLMNK
ncbi:MAG: pseudouridine synthase [Clostridia bacterium]|nr:pseudouridine synthase [Clostridia bacterium]